MGHLFGCLKVFRHLNLCWFSFWLYLHISLSLFILANVASIWSSRPTLITWRLGYFRSRSTHFDLYFVFLVSQMHFWLLGSTKLLGPQNCSTNDITVHRVLDAHLVVWSSSCSESNCGLWNSDLSDYDRVCLSWVPILVSNINYWCN